MNIRDMRDVREQYPDMPDYIKDRVRMEVENQIHKKNQNHLKVAIIPVLVCLVLLSGGVALAKSDYLRQLFTTLGDNATEAEKYVQTDTIESKDDWLTVDEVYLDGVNLVYIAHLNDNQTDVPYDMGDHAYVDGVDCLTDRFDVLGDGVYQGKIFLSEEMIENNIRKDEIQVDVELYVGDNTELPVKRDFSFTVSGKNMALAEMKENEQIIYMTDANGVSRRIGVVKADFTVSPSAIKCRLHYEFEGEDAKENREKYVDDKLSYMLIDDSGNEKEVFDLMNSCGYENETDDDNYSSIDFWVELNRFDMHSKYMTIVPVSMDYYTEGELEGKMIDGTQVVHDEYAITFSLE